VVSIEKDSRNQHGGYDYVSAEAMIAKTRQVMHDVGLVLVRDEASVQHLDEGLLVLKQEFRLVDVVDGASWTFFLDMPCPARKGMPEDKAVMAAMTSSLNYAIRDVMMVSRGREDQIEAIEDRDEQAGAEAAQPAPARMTGAQIVDKAKKMFAPADVVLDTRETVSEADMARLRKILSSGIAGEGAEERWLRGAEAFVKARGIEREYTSLAEIPSAVAAKIIARYVAEYMEWAKSKEAA
jgi:hypothetical protein